MINNKVKIGSRILSDNDMNKLLPYNDDIYSRIENIRKTASVYSDELLQELSDKNNPINKDNEFRRHFNNIFSILGERGSGKTSVLLTIKYKLMKDERNIVLPLIVPEKMGEVSDIVGSLIGVFESIVNEFENDIQGLNKDRKFNPSDFNGYFEDCRFKENNPLRKAYVEVLKQYRYTKVDYREILIKEYVGFNEYINTSKNIIDSDQKLILAFEDFITELIKVKSFINKGGKQLLIIAFFDDIDLSYRRCTELVNVILRYLSNANIVVFMSGSESTFAEALTMDLLNIENISYEHMNTSFLPIDIKEKNETLLNSRKILVQDILKKAIPPTLRYEIPCKSDKDRAEFRFSTKEDDYEEGYKTIKELIVDKFIGNENNFLGKKDETIYPYFKIIDSTARGAMNIYYFLYNLDQSNDKVKNIKSFVSILVSSSKVLNKYRHDIDKIIDIRDDIENTFIDYEYIKLLQDKSDNLEVEDALTLFMLANFIENIISIETKRKPHGHNVLSKILNHYNDDFRMYPNVNNIRFILDFYHSISDNISEHNISKINDDDEKNLFLNIYFKSLNNTIEKSEYKNITDFFRKVRYIDETWLNEKVNIIMKYSDEKEVIISRNIIKEFEKLSMKDIRLDSSTSANLKLRLNIIKNNIISSYEINGVDKDYEYYQDLIFYLKRTLDDLNYVYEIDDIFVEDLDELIEEIEDVVDKKIVNFFEGLSNHICKDRFIYKKDHEEINSQLKKILHSNNSIIFSRLIRDQVFKFSAKLESLDKIIINDKDIKKYTLRVDEIMKVFEKIVRISIYKDIKYNKKDENFYLIFNKIRKELIANKVDNEYKGFNTYIEDKEVNSKEVNINV